MKFEPASALGTVTEMKGLTGLEPACHSSFVHPLSLGSPLLVPPYLPNKPDQRPPFAMVERAPLHAPTLPVSYSFH